MTTKCSVYQPYDTVEKEVGPNRLKTGLWHCDRRVGVSFLSGGLVLGRNQFLNESVSDALSWGIKWPGREAPHLPPIHKVSSSRMYGPMLPLLHTSEEIRKLARDRSVPAELFSEGKTDRYSTAVGDIAGICVTS